MIGVDEVGRGAWAGPLVAVAVRLDGVMVGLHDSKVLTPRRRTQLASQIRLQATGIGIGWVRAHEVDELGLTEANRAAMLRAVTQLQHDGQKVIVDGHVNYLRELPNTENMIQADARVPCVAAASIIAKVARDIYMQQLDLLISGYDFSKHKGYGTQLHSATLAKHGPSSQHRKSFKPVAKLVKSHML